MPTIVFSEIGVSRTRFSPNSSSSPSLTLKAPWKTADVLAHQEDVLVPAHLLGHRVAQRLTHPQRRHQPAVLRVLVGPVALGPALARRLPGPA